MSSYAKTVNFAVKDGLASGDPAKVIKGTEIDTEFNNIATMSATKQDSLPVSDSTAIVFNASDATKKVRLLASGLTTGTTRVLTVQDADGTIAILVGGTLTATTSVVTPLVDSGTTGSLSLKTNNGTTIATFGNDLVVRLASAGTLQLGGNPAQIVTGNAVTDPVNFYSGVVGGTTALQFQILGTASATSNATITGAAVAGTIGATINVTGGRSLAITPDTTIAGGLNPNFTSAETAIAGAGTVTAIAHGLGVLPRNVYTVLRNKTTELGYSVNDETPFSGNFGGTVEVSVDATNITVLQASTIQVLRKDTGAQALITAANWKIVARAWK